MAPDNSVLVLFSSLALYLCNNLMCYHDYYYCYYFYCDYYDYYYCYYNFYEVLYINACETFQEQIFYNFVFIIMIL